MQWSLHWPPVRSATTSLDKPKEYVKASAVDNCSVVTGVKRPHRSVIIDDDEQQHATALKLGGDHDVGARATFPGYGDALVVCRPPPPPPPRVSAANRYRRRRSGHDGTRPPTTDGRRQTATGSPPGRALDVLGPW